MFRPCPVVAETATNFRWISQADFWSAKPGAAPRAHPGGQKLQRKLNLYISYIYIYLCELERLEVQSSSNEQSSSNGSQSCSCFSASILCMKHFDTIWSWPFPPDSHTHTHRTTNIGSHAGCGVRKQLDPCQVPYGSIYIIYSIPYVFLSTQNHGISRAPRRLSCHNSRSRERTWRHLLLPWP